VGKSLFSILSAIKSGPALGLGLSDISVLKPYLFSDGVR